MQYRRYRSDTVAKAVESPDRITGRRVTNGYVLEVTHFSAGVAAEEERITELGYTDNTGNDKILSKSKPEPFAAITIRGTLWLEEGEAPYVEVTNMDVGNELYLSVHGRLWPVESMRSNNAEVQPEDNLSH